MTNWRRIKDSAQEASSKKPRLYSQYQNIETAPVSHHTPSSIMREMDDPFKNFQIDDDDKIISSDKDKQFEKVINYQQWKIRALEQMLSKQTDLLYDKDEEIELWKTQFERLAMSFTKLEEFEEKTYKELEVIQTTQIQPPFQQPMYGYNNQMAGQHALPHPQPNAFTPRNYANPPRR
ncbi:hypothetical protein MP638_004132 [Amoeboaphelidium occidentale]|nr:hypothetical protein MP638_004132 [Amoeboaphelidium occidentale]